MKFEFSRYHPGALRHSWASLCTHWQCGTPVFPHPCPLLIYRLIFFLIFANWIWDRFLCFHLHFLYFAEVNPLYNLFVKRLAFPQLSSSTKDTWPKSGRLTASLGGINFCEWSKLLTFFPKWLCCLSTSWLIPSFPTDLKHHFFHLLNMSLCLFLDSQHY